MPPSLIIVVAIALCAAAWAAPFAAAAFVIVATIPFYALLHVLGITNEGLTGPVFGSAGVTALLRLITYARPSVARVRFVLLFVTFAAFWTLRWYQDPPVELAHEAFRPFAERAPAFMLVFAAVPFFTGLVLRDVADVRRLIVWVSRWGILGIAIVAIYYVTGQPSQIVHENRWQPIPHLGTINTGADLGLGALATVMVLPSGPGIAWTAVRFLVIAVSAALILTIGQRGPFLFFVVGILAQILITPQTTRRTRWAAVGVTVASIGYAVLSMVGEPAGRVLSAESYNAEANYDRLGALALAFELIPKRPFFGWGGSLVGRVFDFGPWDYVHVTMLDALVEAGIVGALPFWLLVGGILAMSIRALTSKTPAAAHIRSFLPFFLLVFLSSQTSGHISAAKHLWVALGILVVLADPAGARSRAPVRATSLMGDWARRTRTIAAK